MRVLHVVQPTDGGAPAVALQYAEHQRDHGDDVHVASGSGWVADHAPDGVGFIRWSAGRSPDAAVIQETRQLRAIVRSVQPDVLHLHASKAGLAGRLAVRGRVPTVFQPHAWSWTAVAGAQRRAAVAWERWAVRWTSACVCVSRSELVDGEKHGVDVSGASTVPNGVDVDRYRPSDPVGARSALGLPPDQPVVLCVGRLTRQKGQEDLLKAWPTVIARRPDAQLVLVGDGPDRDRLTAQASGLPGVRFVGDRDDTATWYAACDVAVFPSRWEGMALAPLEAMASGRPVVAFDVEGVAESVAPASESDGVVQRGDVRGLGSAVARRLEAPEAARAEGRRQREQAVVRHSADRAAAEVRRVYGALV